MPAIRYASPSSGRGVTRPGRCWLMPSPGGAKMNSSRPARMPCIPATSTGGLRRSTGPLGRRDEHHHRPVAHDAAVEEPQGGDHLARRAVVREGHRLLHDRVRVLRSRMRAQGDRHLAERIGGRPVERHVAPPGEGGPRGRGGEAVGRVLGVGAPLLAHPLEVSGAAEDVALAGEARDRDARDHVREPRRHRERRLLERHRDESPVGPRLVHVADVEPERLRDPVVVEAEGPAEVDGEPVHVGAVETRVVERRPERRRPERELALGEVPPEAARPDARDRGPVGYRSHGRSNSYRRSIGMSAARWPQSTIVRRAAGGLDHGKISPTWVLPAGHSGRKIGKRPVGERLIPSASEALDEWNTGISRWSGAGASPS